MKKLMALLVLTFLSVSAYSVPVGLDTDDRAVIDSIKNVTPGTIPMATSSGTLEDSALRQVDPATPNSAPGLVTPGSLTINNGSLEFIGGVTVSNAVRSIVVDLPNGNRVIAAGHIIGDTRGLVYVETGTEGTSVFNSSSSQVVSTPFSIGAAATGDFVTTDFTIIPAEAGELVVTLWLGTEAEVNTGTALQIYREAKMFDAGDIGSPSSFGLGNPYILDTAQPVFIRFEGIDLRGGPASASDLLPEGTVTPTYTSKVYPFEIKEVADLTDISNVFTGASAIGADATDGIRFTRFDGSTVDVLYQGVPRLTSLSIRGQSTHVQTGTTVGGTSVTVDYQVSNPSQVDGDLTLTWNGAQVSSSVDPESNTFALILPAVTLSTPGQTVDLVMSGTASQTAGGGVFSRTFTVTALPPAEFVYYGYKSSATPSTDLTGLSQAQITASGQVIGLTIGESTAGEFLHIYAPTDHRISRINNLDFGGQNIRDEFTYNANFGSISGQAYESYVETIGVSGLTPNLEVVVQ